MKRKCSLKLSKKIDISRFSEDDIKISLQPEVLLPGFILKIVKLLVPISTKLTVINGEEKVQFTHIGQSLNISNGQKIIKC